MKNPFTLISSEIKYKNPWIQLKEDKVIRPNWNNWIFGVVEMKDGCTILAITNDNQVYITKDFHYGIWDISIELISWAIDDWESPIICAQRELFEEAGIAADEWIDLWYIDPFTTVVKSRNYLFLAKKLRKTGNENSDNNTDSTLKSIPFNDLLTLCMESKISHGGSVSTILKAKEYITY
jgi:NUDIX domain